MYKSKTSPLVLRKLQQPQGTTEAWIFCKRKTNDKNTKTEPSQVLWSGVVLLNSMEHSPSWEANRFLASPEIPHILQNLKVHYHIQSILPLIPNLSQINPVHAPHPTSWKPSLILLSHLYLELPNSFLVHPTFVFTQMLKVLSMSFTCHILEVLLVSQPKSLKFQNVVKVMCSHINGLMLCLQWSV